MPYIEDENRKPYNKSINELVDIIEKEGFVVGDMNYVISSILWKCWRRMGGNYTAANSLLGVLTGVLLEYYTRKVKPYEMDKENLNGTLNDD